MDSLINFTRFHLLFCDSEYIEKVFLAMQEMKIRKK
jgi:hypothetical protein